MYILFYLIHDTSIFIFLDHEIFLIFCMEIKRSDTPSSPHQASIFIQLELIMYHLGLLWFAVSRRQHWRRPHL